MSATRIRVFLLIVALCLTAPLAVTAPPASASTKTCGKQIIDEYFFSGRIKYHTQDCYASALKQLDPDAKMYSGIMGAIRAARARDRAADRKAASPAVAPADSDDYGGGYDGDSGGDPLVPGDSGMPIEPLIDPDLTVDPSDEQPLEEGGDVIAVGSGEAALPTPTIGGQLPLPVFILIGLASILTLVGLGGLTVRWLDGAR